VITKDDYKKALNILTEFQLNVLKILYSCPNSSATAKELAELLNFKSFHAANLNIGEIGKKIVSFLNIQIDNYYNGKEERPAYFKVIGDYSEEYGWEMNTNLQNALEELSIVSIDEKYFDEISYNEGIKLFKEGKVKQIFTNIYERNPKARKECIKYYGYSCSICGFNFEKVYGKIGESFIEIHHLTPVSEINNIYNIDPIKDLRPVCSNCHSMIHRKQSPYTIDEVKKMVRAIST
jgi:5-methylcytosine-specific restriction enzyme A